MAEDGKRQSRKSKLVPRTDGENVDETEETSAKIPKIEVPVESTAGIHADVPLQFSVKVEVETCLEESTKEHHIPECPNTKYSTEYPSQTHSILKDLGAELRNIHQPKGISLLKKIQQTNTYETEKLKQYRISNNRTNQASVLCVLKPQEMLENYDGAKSWVEFQKPNIPQSMFVSTTFDQIVEELENLTDIVNPADRILSIEAKNTWGRFSKPIEISEKDEMLNSAIDNWRVWLTRPRNPPLTYKCYLCLKAWWHFHDFREHVRNHLEMNMKIHLEMLSHEYHMIIYYGKQPDFREIPVEGSCWKCGKPFSNHARDNLDNQIFYRCTGCKKSFHTCVFLREHETVCEFYIRKIYDDRVTLDAKFFECQLCKMLCETKGQHVEHMVLSHSVRSDIPVAITKKTCNVCLTDYILGRLHICNTKVSYISCSFCYRYFPNRFFELLHTFNNKDDCRCKICDKRLAKHCMEAEHMVEHSEMFVMGFKCMFCTDVLVFSTLEHLTQHRLVHHKKKRQGTQKTYQLMVVPKQCFGPRIQSTVSLPMHTYNSIQPRNPSTEEKDEDLYISVSPTPERQQELSKMNAADLQTTLNLECAKLEEENYFLTEEAEVQIKTERVVIEENPQLDYEEILSKVFQVSKVIKTVPAPEVTVKAEPVIKEELIEEEEYDDDIIILDNMPELEIDLVADELSETETIDFQNFKEEHDTHTESIEDYRNNSCDESDNEWTIEDYEDGHADGADANQIKKPVKKKVILIDTFGELAVNETKVVTNKRITDGKANKPRAKNKIYFCNKCEFQGFHKEFKEHTETSCKPKKHKKQKIPQVSEHKKKVYKCSKCFMGFSKLRFYTKHFSAHGFQMFQCPQCMEVRHSDLLKHIVGHIKQSYIKIDEELTEDYEKLYHCKNCNGKVARDDFFEHWERHLELKVMKEVDAEELVSSKENDGCETALDRHTLQMVIGRLMLKTRGRTWPGCLKDCCVCHRAFDRRNDIKRHLIEHLLQDAYANKLENKHMKCQICHVDFMKADTYKQHMRDHAGLPVYNCQICDKNFSDSSNFTKHKKVHNLKVLVCDICQKKYQAKISLERHMEIHKVTEPIQCPLCPKVFYETSTYKRHQRIAHQKIPTKYCCVVCRKKFDTLRKKWDHQWQVHKERKYNADCPICSKSFRKFQDVKNHVKVVHGKSMRMVKVNTKADLLMVKINTDSELVDIDSESVISV